MACPQFARKRNENLQSTSAVGLPALTLGEVPVPCGWLGGP